jgi:hypothetical protein
VGPELGIDARVRPHARGSLDSPLSVWGLGHHRRLVRRSCCLRRSDGCRDVRGGVRLRRLSCLLRVRLRRRCILVWRLLWRRCVLLWRCWLCVRLRRSSLVGLHGLRRLRRRRVGLRRCRRGLRSRCGGRGCLWGRRGRLFRESVDEAQ